MQTVFASYVVEELAKTSLLVCLALKKPCSGSVFTRIGRFRRPKTALKASTPETNALGTQTRPHKQYYQIPVFLLGTNLHP